MDSIDRRILKNLQSEGRLTYSELASRVGLTTTPCIERVRRLESDGVIRGYRAELSPDALGAAMVVFVEVRLDASSKDGFEQFRRAVKRIAEIQECYLVTGDFDFLIKVRVADMEAYRDFLENELLNIRGVQDSKTVVAMDTVKETMAIAISAK